MATPVMTPIPMSAGLKVADEVFLAVALLTRERPDAEDYSVDEILARLEKENLCGAVRPGVAVHIRQHCVANKPANPGNYRMLIATARNRRRLYRQGDPVDPTRVGRTVPDKADIPVTHHYLVDWYQSEYCKPVEGGPAARPEAAGDGWLGGLLAMQGLGRGMWKEEGPDAYVSRLREGWE